MPERQQQTNVSPPLALVRAVRLSGRLHRSLRPQRPLPPPQPGRNRRPGTPSRRKHFDQSDAPDYLHALATDPRFALSLSAHGARPALPDPDFQYLHASSSTHPMT
jgi:hypothetical protein